MKEKKFKRVKEDFVCQNCGLFVRGNGYTNHCPKCLYSKHVDINPGDRKERCGGLMEPIGIKIKNGKYYILHRCKKCKMEKLNKASKDDDFKEMIKISSRI